jgi:hypothetical protein
MAIPHALPGDITSHCLDGCIAGGLAGKTRELRAGEPHDVLAIEPTSARVTIMLRPA